ncbi:MFS transporter [Brevibacillus centrosporus]|uniref:MFS transporter n=1 Tax=Brevibacillus centrosporus TaxID=54910 RepID=UPI000F0A00F1|nr:MFS transporter [Brevibacillus centrosporus]MEC2131447.1 MFS transporter [Brevibacillus centrosporus]MED1951099.1 MFS transporter [Brevibacillus centrosporus]RNB72528.1 MFS transporter [Brevibacillus centrosporus]GED31119.1 MFS transporter [Brevibacillus centrosporus]
MSWRRNARILWICNFIISGSMSMIMPFLPLFLMDMGVPHGKEVSMWTGMIFSATFLSAAIMAPVWGAVADKYGQKTNLVRAGIGMGIINILMFFTTTPLYLLVLRFVFGFFSGFITVSYSYLSKTTPREELGKAIGFLYTGGMSGGIIGPLFGGALSDWFGYHTVFAVTGGLMIITVLLVQWLLPPDRVEVAAGEVRKTGTFREVLANPNLTILFFATFAIQTATMSTSSMMSIFVRSIVGDVNNLAFLAGLVTSVTGIANIIGSPILGRLGDRFGQSKILPIIMFCTGLVIFQQVWTDSIYPLYAWRFCQGLLLGGMLPSIQTLIKKRSPDFISGRSYGLNSSCQFLGNLTGPLIGGFIAGHFSVSYVFVFSGLVLMLGSAIVKWRIPLRGENKKAA